MSNNDNITLFYSPQTRATGTLTLLEEMGAPYQLHVLNMKAGEQRQAPYLAINPMGKVPALLHHGELITEQIAVFMYLAELFPETGLSPAPSSRLRGTYLRWMAFYASCFEPALVDKSQQNPPASPSMCPYGDFDTMLNTVTAQLAKGPYLLGEQLSAADILWGNALNWGTMFKLVPETPIIMEYVQRITSRPSFVKVGAMDAAWAAEHERAVNEMNEAKEGKAA
ncbi:glutathione S-transferase family protein [Undibacterium sp. CY18W]|uniref:Glutathione S-transferase family protein n=1 Tax=Undibacterium hunanense TaxID=2762292 RepID=A0ABR6ZT86_9BURK|nr:glutathione S-transferase family protein [Undibacterium hunanense]MBC3919069.1 glutathione S-transferase family protein [Undibacterium hunanense]